MFSLVQTRRRGVETAKEITEEITAGLTVSSADIRTRSCDVTASMLCQTFSANRTY